MSATQSESLKDRLQKLHQIAAQGSLVELQSALEDARREGHAIERVLKAENERGWNVLMFAARYGHTAIVQYLLQIMNTKEFIDAVNKDNRTALDIAKSFGHTEVVGLLEPEMLRGKQCS